MESYLDEQGQKWIVAATVGNKFGACMNSKQISAAIKSDIFGPESAIMMHLRSGSPYRLNLVYKCSECEKIHLLACPDDFSVEEKQEFLKNDIIYLDRTLPGEFITVTELSSLLDDFKDAQDIVLETMYGEQNDIESSFYCTQVLKCKNDQCFKPHLDCKYHD